MVCSEKRPALGVQPLRLGKECRADLYPSGHAIVRRLTECQSSMPHRHELSVSGRGFFNGAVNGSETEAILMSPNPTRRSSDRLREHGPLIWASFGWRRRSA